ncbi:Pentatricopeptide repeat-containing protein [Glycine soja]
MSYMQLSQKFYDAFKLCGSPPIARKLHAQLILSGLDASLFLLNNLLHVYSNCGMVDDAFRVFREANHANIFTWNTMLHAFFDSGRMREAENLFDEMPLIVRDSVSWTTMISGYCQNGLPGHSIKTFMSMLRDSNHDIQNCDPFSYTCTMKACGCLASTRLALQLHAHVIKLHLGAQTCIQNSLVDMYIKCGAITLAETIFLNIESPSLFCWNSMIYGYSQLYGPYEALHVFTRMPERDHVSWNTLISVFSQYGHGIRCLSTFVEMCNLGFKPNFMTYGSVLSACASISDLKWGAHLHARILRMEHSLDAFLGSGLIDMYAKCGCLALARRVFNSLGEQNQVSWTCFISGVAQFGLGDDALALFNQMRQASVVLDEFTLATILGVCSGQNYAASGELLHGYAIKSGMDSSVPVGNAIITMYARCGDTEKASLAFRSMPLRDTISWTAMITAFSQNGDIDRARQCFDMMPERNVITWNSMLSTYIQHGFSEEGMKLYVLMRSKAVKPDWVTFATSIRACADLATIKLGTQVVSHVTKFGLSSDVSVANSIVTMQLVIQYVKHRAVLGAKYHRIDWTSISDLPASPIACILNNSSPDAEIQITSLNKEAWDDFENKNIKMALDEILRCKMMAKLGASSQKGQLQYDGWSDANANANGLVGGTGNERFELSQHFLQSVSKSPFPFNTGKQAVKFSAWLEERGKDLTEVGANLAEDLQCGDIFHLLALVSSGELSISPFLPDNGVGEAEDLRSAKRKYDTTESSYSDKAKKSKSFFGVEGEIICRREKGFPGIIISAHQTTISRADILNLLKDNDNYGQTFDEDFQLNIGQSSNYSLPDNILEITKSSDPVPLEENHSESPWEAMAGYARHLLSEYSNKKHAYAICAEVFRVVYAAIQKAGDQGLSMGEISRVINLPGAEIDVLIVDALQAFGQALKVNAYDTVRVVDVLYRHKYFLTPMSDFHLRVVQPSSSKTIEKSDHTCELYESEERDTTSVDTSRNEGCKQNRLGLSRVNHKKETLEFSSGKSCVPILPWVNGDGIINNIVYRVLRRRVLGIVMQNPGILENCRTLLELMVLDKHLIVKKMHQNMLDGGPSLLPELIGSKSSQPKLICREHFFANPMSTSLL